MNTSLDKGYIYVRTHPAYESYNVVKMGETSNIPDRDSEYATGEFIRGRFSLVVEVDLEDRRYIENILQREFEEWHVYTDAGTEFFNKKIIDLIIPYLEKERIEHRRLSPEELATLERKRRVIPPKDDLTLLSKTDVLRKIKSRSVLVPYTPRSDQEIIINESVIHFETNNKGVLVLMCGVGKTLISLWITQKLNINTILIGVPNILLQTQWKDVIKHLYPDIEVLIVDGDISTEDIIGWIKVNRTNCIIITTYASSHKVLTASNTILFTFGMKLLDECHHLTRATMVTDEIRSYENILKINSVKQLSLTATLKHIDASNTYDGVVSNDDVDIFGEIIASRGLSWAISNNILCDYVVQTIVADTDELDSQTEKFHITKEEDKRLFLSAFAALKSISNGHSHHLLIYVNNTRNTEKIIEYIECMSDYVGKSTPYCSVYTSMLTSTEQKNILEKFKQSQTGILVCVYCLGEGWDLPLLDGVVFAENMSSSIRIVQSALRASRKNITEPFKKSKIILPIYDPDGNYEDTSSDDMKKVKTVISQLSREDDTIIHKIKAFRIQLTPPAPCISHIDPSMEVPIGEYDAVFTKKLTLKTVKRSDFYHMTFGKAKHILKSKDIKSKKEYELLCIRDNRFPEHPQDYFTEFKGWIDYLSIDTSTYYTIDECKTKLREYIATYSIKFSPIALTNLCNEVCTLDVRFPAADLWVEYYHKPLSDLVPTIHHKKKSLR